MWIAHVELRIFGALSKKVRANGGSQQKAHTPAIETASFF